MKEALLISVSYLALFFIFPSVLIMSILIIGVRNKNPVKAAALKDWFMKPIPMVLVNGSLSLLTWSGLAFTFYFGYLM